MHITLCDFLSDVVENAIESQATVVIVDIIETKEKFQCLVADNGKGMDPETLAKAQSPFFTDAKHKRAQGLGLPFLKQTIEQTSGRWDIKSEQGFGTSVSFTFNKTHVDTPPVGDIAQTLLQLMGFNGSHELVVNRRYVNKNYSVSRSELVKALEDLSCAGNLVLARKYLVSLEQEMNEL